MVVERDTFFDIIRTDDHLCSPHVGDLVCTLPRHDHLKDADLDGMKENVTDLASAKDVLF